MVIPHKRRGSNNSVPGAYTRYASDAQSDIEPTSHSTESDWERTPGGGYIRDRQYYPPVATYDAMLAAGYEGGPLNLDQFGGTLVE